MCIIILGHYYAGLFIERKNKTKARESVVVVIVVAIIIMAILFLLLFPISYVVV